MMLVPMHFEDGPTLVYVGLGEHFGADTSFDCGVYAIKFMEYWTEGKKLNDWNYDTIKLYRLEIMLDIILDHKNSAIRDALNAIDSRPQLIVRRNHPRNKHKEIKNLFIAPGTKSMLWRDAGLPKKKPIKRS
ncbi:uncharacterized protein DS421_14g458770 [Arachis hypogaea]|nr:uncharacterized protein DS421_14g458770 [Arachis hypogaea]